MKRHKRIGLMLWTAPGLGAGFERGEWAEQAGYDDLWLPDAEGLQDPLTLGAALGTIGISLANITGPTAFATFGSWGLALPSGIIMFILWLILLRFGRAGPESQQSIQD